MQRGNESISRLGNDSFVNQNDHCSNPPIMKAYQGPHGADQSDLLAVSLTLLLPRKNKRKDKVSHGKSRNNQAHNEFIRISVGTLQHENSSPSNHQELKKLNTKHGNIPRHHETSGLRACQLLQSCQGQRQGLTRGSVGQLISIRSGMRRVF